ncbi:TolC family outer membrane protein [Proteobacteria bacterium 005FR1]|nr:TolC family outer membrane protein [Proteobacteria bacterium 005FR1]
MKAFFPSVSLACLLMASGLSHGDTLLEIYQQALENDPQLAADRAALEAGLQADDIARSALLPQISASAQRQETDFESTQAGSQIFGSFVTPADETISTALGDSRSWGIRLSQPLFDMQAWYGYKQGNVQTKAALTQFQAAQQEFILRVASTYFDVLRAIQALETALAELEALESQLEQTRQRYEVGLTAITEVHEVQARYDSAVAAVVEARGNLGIAYEALEVLTAREHDTIAPIEDNFPVSNPVPAERSEWVNFALENNYTLKTAQLNSEIAEYTAKIRKSAHLPTLGLTAGYSDSETTDESEVVGIDQQTGLPYTRESRREAERDGTSITVELSVPIYSGGRISGQRRQAYYEAMRAQDLFNLTRRETIQTARSAHLAVETRVAQVEALRQAIVSSESALEATQAGYEVGTRTLVDVLLAQQTLYTAERNYYSALYDYIINSLRLKQAAGILSPEDVVELNQWLNAQDQISRSDYEQ